MSYLLQCLWSSSGVYHGLCVIPWVTEAEADLGIDLHCMAEDLFPRLLEGVIRHIICTSLVSSVGVPFPLCIMCTGTAKLSIKREMQLQHTWLTLENDSWGFLSPKIKEKTTSGSWDKHFDVAWKIAEKLLWVLGNPPRVHKLIGIKKALL